MSLLAKLAVWFLAVVAVRNAYGLAAEFFIAWYSGAEFEGPNPSRARLVFEVGFAAVALVAAGIAGAATLRAPRA